MHFTGWSLATTTAVWGACLIGCGAPTGVTDNARAVWGCQMLALPPAGRARSPGQACCGHVQGCSGPESDHLVHSQAAGDARLDGRQPTLGTGQTVALLPSRGCSAGMPNGPPTTASDGSRHATGDTAAQRDLFQHVAGSQPVKPLPCQVPCWRICTHCRCAHPHHLSSWGSQVARPCSSMPLTYASHFVTARECHAQAALWQGLDNRGC